MRVTICMESHDQAIYRIICIDHGQASLDQQQQGYGCVSDAH